MKILQSDGLNFLSSVLQLHLELLTLVYFLFCNNGPNILSSIDSSIGTCHWQVTEDFFPSLSFV